MNEEVSCKNIVALLIELTKEKKLQWKDSSYGLTAEFPDGSHVHFRRTKKAEGEIEYSVGSDMIMWYLDEEEKVLAKELFDAICDNDLDSLHATLKQMAEV